MQRYITAKILAGLILIVFFIGLCLSLTHAPLSVDESYTYYLLRSNIFDLTHFISLDVHPPVYYWIMKAWTSIFGLSSIALRLPSVLFMVATLFMAWKLVKKLFNSDKLATIALALAAISPMVVWLAQDARMYALVALIGISSTYVFASIQQNKRMQPWVLYGILVALGFLTHYYAILVVAVHAIWRMCVILRENKGGSFRLFVRHYFSKQLLAAIGVCAVMTAFWIPVILSQFQTIQAQGFWYPAVSPGTLVGFATSTLFYLHWRDVDIWLEIQLALTAIALIALGARTYRLSSKIQKNGILLLLYLVLLPVLMLFLLSLPPLRPSFTERYLISSLVSLPLLVAVLAWHKANTRKIRSVSYIVTAAIAFGFALGTHSIYVSGPQNSDRMSSLEIQELIRSAQSQAVPGQPIVIKASVWHYYRVHFAVDRYNPVYFVKDNSSTERHSALAMMRGDGRGIDNITEFKKAHPQAIFINFTSSDITTADR